MKNLGTTVADMRVDPVRQLLIEYQTVRLYPHYVPDGPSISLLTIVKVFLFFC